MVKCLAGGVYETTPQGSVVVQALMAAPGGFERLEEIRGKLEMATSNQTHLPNLWDLMFKP